MNWCYDCDPSVPLCVEDFNKQGKTIFKFWTHTIAKGSVACEISTSLFFQIPLFGHHHEQHVVSQFDCTKANLIHYHTNFREYMGIVQANISHCCGSPSF